MGSIKKRIKPVASITLGPKTLSKAKQICAEREISLSAFINQVLVEHLEKKSDSSLSLAETRTSYGKKKRKKRKC